MTGEIGGRYLLAYNVRQPGRPKKCPPLFSASGLPRLFWAGTPAGAAESYCRQFAAGRAAVAVEVRKDLHGGDARWVAFVVAPDGGRWVATRVAALAGL